jgi:hypothetical protein
VNERENEQSKRERKRDGVRKESVRMMSERVEAMDYGRWRHAMAMSFHRRQKVMKTNQQPILVKKLKVYKSALLNWSQLDDVKALVEPCTPSLTPDLYAFVDYGCIELV